VTYLIGFVVAAVVGLLLVWSGLWWALPVLVIAFAIYMVREMREGMSRPTESVRTSEPTGVPRSSPGGTASTGAGDTANERVGQA